MAIALLPEGSPIGDPGPQWGPFGLFESPLGPHFVSKVPIFSKSVADSVLKALAIAS